MHETVIGSSVFLGSSTNHDLFVMVTHPIDRRGSRSSIAGNEK
jgi:hypothetical protein